MTSIHGTWQDLAGPGRIGRIGRIDRIHRIK
jgi:hypothetical protein